MKNINNLNELNLEVLSKSELKAIDGGGFSRNLGYAVGVVFFTSLCGIAKAAEIIAGSRIK